NVDQAQRSGGDAGTARAQPQCRRPYRGTDGHSDVGGSRQPAECLGPISRLDGIGNVSLNHADRSTASSLNDPRQQEKPDRVGERENEVGDAGRGKADEQRRTPPILVGESSPPWRANELRRSE